MEVLCSTGALIGRPNGRNPRLLEDLTKKLACDGLEFMMYSTWYEDVDAITEYVQSLGLHIPVYHCQKTVGEELTKGDFAEANRKVRTLQFEIDRYTADWEEAATALEALKA